MASSIRSTRARVLGLALALTRAPGKRQPRASACFGCEVRMIRRLLIANRGEIVCRIAAHARGGWASPAIAVYSDADRDALHVRAATRPIISAPAPAADSYLNIERHHRASRAARGPMPSIRATDFCPKTPNSPHACARGWIRSSSGRRPRRSAPWARRAPRRPPWRRSACRWPRDITARIRSLERSRRGGAHRLSADHQGERGRRRQGHAGGRVAPPRCRQRSHRRSAWRGRPLAMIAC